MINKIVRKLSDYNLSDAISFTVKIFILLFAFNQFYYRAWVGEDAFIFFRYVDNFVNGHGLVFNVGERVEGFTSPLWVFVLSFFRISSSWELRQIAIAFGLVASTTTIAILLFLDYRGRVAFPVGILLLITNSAFRDFATSGFETSLTLLLLTIVALLIKHTTFLDRPAKVGFVTSLLVLSRPEALLILAFLFVVYAADLLRTRNLIRFVKFISFPALLVGGYQIFRMGYYASLLPNTFYAKKGGELYLNQGLNYLLDFVYSYPFTALVLFLGVLVVFLNKENELFKGRLSLIFLSILLFSYVLYSGGDFMHGRSLLMAFTLLTISVGDIWETKLNKYFPKIGFLGWGTTLIVLGFLIVAGLSQKSFTAVRHKQINGINDERVHFNFDKVGPDEFGEYLMERITGQFEWRERGYYYRDIAEATDTRILVNMPNIGFFGYAAGDNVSVMGTGLIDPYQARIPIKKRGTIGHEGETRWDYMLYRKPSFSYTPFKQWNVAAQFRYEESEYAGWIKGDSDDSFIPIFDISDEVFLKRFSDLVHKDVKESIDLAQRNYLTSLTPTDLEEGTEEYLGFLRYYWVPYAGEEGSALYWETVNQLFGDKSFTSSFDRFEAVESQAASYLFSKVSKPLTVESFVHNVFGLNGKEQGQVLQETTLARYFCFSLCMW